LTRWFDEDSSLYKQIQLKEFRVLDQYKQKHKQEQIDLKFSESDQKIHKLRKQMSALYSQMVNVAVTADVLKKWKAVDEECEEEHRLEKLQAQLEALQKKKAQNNSANARRLKTRKKQRYLIEKRFWRRGLVWILAK
jgi:hypothetical protein